METVLSNMALNPAQLFILQTFATAKDEQDKEELITFYLDYIQQKIIHGSK